MVPNGLDYFSCYTMMPYFPAILWCHTFLPYYDAILCCHTCSSSPRSSLATRQLELHLRVEGEIAGPPSHPYSPDWLHGTFFLFPKMNFKLKSLCFDTVEEIQGALQMVLDKLNQQDFQGVSQAWLEHWEQWMRWWPNLNQVLFLLFTGAVLELFDHTSYVFDRVTFKLLYSTSMLIVFKHFLLVFLIVEYWLLIADDLNQAHKQCSMTSCSI